MKTVKRALALVLALTMLLAMSATVFAADDTGSITINNAVVGQPYTIYEILYLESYNATEGQEAYSYKATDAWKNFINSDDIKGTYVTVDSQGYVTWKDGADVAKFAELAKEYATNNSIQNQGLSKATSAEVKFENLNLGYYLVYSDLGALCSLDTTNPNVTIQEKNSKPTAEKEVQENSTNNWGATNDAGIGGTVNFRTTIKVVDGNPKDYVLHDKMSAGLTFSEENAKNLTVAIGNRTLVAGTDYTLVTTGLDDDCTFEVRFTENILKPNDVVTVSYSATVNSNAVIAGTGNPNEIKISYKNTDNTTGETTPSKTYTYVWKIDVFKYTMRDSTETALKDAEFVLYRKDGDKTYYAKVDAENKITGWTENQAEASKFTTPNNGKFTITGLDSGTYYLEETKAPAGYNILKDPIEIQIQGTVDSSTNVGTATVKYGDKLENTANPDIKILNNAGAELPSTGGIGTTIFYVLGGLLVVCAGVLLITKRRMNKNA